MRPRLGEHRRGQRGPDLEHHGCRRRRGGLDEGAFGDLGVLCQEAPEGETLAAGTDPGVTADSIQVSTFSDPGFPGRLGLNQEMFDTAEAFTNWCNEHGGINGRQIVLKLRDAKLTEFQQRVIEACDEGDFMSVGGGAVFDDTGQTDRLACGAPDHLRLRGDRDRGRRRTCRSSRSRTRATSSRSAR